LKAWREDSSETERLVAVTVSDTKEGRMSEQDRVDTPEHDDEVEGHGFQGAMTDDPDSSESDDVEAHGFHGAMTQEPDSSDSDDVEAHGFHGA
jgi:hypothetical protein